jgi:hypothetical protein
MSYSCDVARKMRVLFSDRATAPVPRSASVSASTSAGGGEDAGKAGDLLATATATETGTGKLDKGGLSVVNGTGTTSMLNLPNGNRFPDTATGIGSGSSVTVYDCLSFFFFNFVFLLFCIFVSDL